MTYALTDAWEQARERLRLLEEAHDPATFRRLDALGLSPGAVRRMAAGGACLDVGAGAGSVARRLAGHGRVLAVDIDTCRRGAVVDLGRRLPEMLDRRGLLDVRADVDLPQRTARSSQPM